MEIRNAQNLVKNFLEKKKWLPSNENDYQGKYERMDVFVHMIEELGEFAREVLYKESNRELDKPRGEDANENMKKELSDVLFMTLKLAVTHNIDLQTEFLKKFKEIENRYLNK